MSQSPNGYICFGVPVEEETNPFYRDLDEDERLEAEEEAKEGEEIGDLSDYLLRREGIPSPWVGGEYPFEIPARDPNLSWSANREVEKLWVKTNHPEWQDIYDTYSTRKKVIEKLSLPVGIRDFGYERVHRFVIYIPGTLQVSSEWGNEPIDPKILTMIHQGISVEHAQVQKAKTFCEENGLPPFTFDNVHWILGSVYG